MHVLGTKNKTKQNSSKINTDGLEPNFGLTEEFLHTFDSHILTSNNIQNKSELALLAFLFSAV